MLRGEEHMPRDKGNNREGILIFYSVLASLFGGHNCIGQAGDLYGVELLCETI